MWSTKFLRFQFFYNTSFGDCKQINSAAAAAAAGAVNMQQHIEAASAAAVAGTMLRMTKKVMEWGYYTATGQRENGNRCMCLTLIHPNVTSLIITDALCFHLSVK